MIMCENIEESNLKSMTEEELSDFIKTLKEYMESEKQTKQNMQDEIFCLKAENKLLHNMIEDKENNSTEVNVNNEGGWTEEEMEIASKGWGAEYCS